MLRRYESLNDPMRTDSPGRGERNGSGNRSRGRELWTVDGGDSEVLGYREREPTPEGVRGVHVREPLP